MAIVPGYEFDVFISYAHADNEDGWVEKFSEKLKTALIRRLGDTQQLRIFLDANEVKGGNTRLPELLQAARASACFLAVGSPSYIVRPWTQDELKEFAGSHTDADRLFLIEVMPLASEDSYPHPLDDIIRTGTEFWKTVGAQQTMLPLSFHSDLDDITTKTYVLADTISKKLRTLRLLPDAPLKQAASAGVPRSSAAGERKTVLLAQATEDVDDEMDQVRSFLEQYSDEIALLPTSGYPQGGDAFCAAFRADLAQADYMVQLLGKRAGRTPPDLPQGYTRFQGDEAKSAGVKLLQWRRPDFDITTVADPAYRQMLEAESVIASGLEAFKQQVLKELRRKEEKKAPPQQDFHSSTVFINADDKDMNVAKSVERECVQNALTAILPMSGPSSEAIRTDLTENLTDCDMLIFIYGDTTQEWIRTQLRFYNKVQPKRTVAPKLLAICSGPPPDKPDPGMTFPNARFVEMPGGWNMDAIRQLIVEAGP